MDLIFQQGDWDCGPTCLVNALRLRGRRIEARDAIRWTEATEAGTSAAKLMRTLTWLKVAFAEYSSPGEKRSWSRLTKTNRPALLCVDSDQHWVLLVSGVGRRIVVWDPDNALGIGGLRIYGRAEFMKRWASSTGRYYGIFTR